MALDVDEVAQLPDTRVVAEVEWAWGLRADGKEAIVIVVKVIPLTALMDRSLYCKNNFSKSFVGLGIIVNIAIALIGMRSLEVLARAGMGLQPLSLPTTGGMCYSAISNPMCQSGEVEAILGVHLRTQIIGHR